MNRRGFLTYALGAATGAAVGVVGMAIKEEGSDYRSTLIMDQQNKHPEMSSSQIRNRVQAHMESSRGEIVSGIGGAVSGVLLAHVIG